jgi:1,4-dihydroxy-2-naphthoyl-CoA hydrolase
MDKQKVLTLLNKMSEDTLMSHLGIKYTDVGEDFLEATMPVNSNVYQPARILHGGATAALAESVGSAASAVLMNADKNLDILGIELAINHLKSKVDGVLTARANLIHKGATLHLWQVTVKDEKDNMIAHAKISNLVRRKLKK